MRKVFFIYCFLLLVVGVSAQTNTSVREVENYQGQAYMPFIFEPYRAEYGINVDFLGEEFTLFKYSSQIIELEDHWSEVQNWQIPKTPDTSAEDLSVTSEIDLKTGLLKEISAEFRGTVNGKYAIAKQQISFLSENFSVDSSFADQNGKVKKSLNASFPLKEKIYPCQSMTFFSYLPLNDNFAGTFTCAAFDYDEEKRKDVLSLNRQKITVVGQEKITVKAGTFDCYKIKQSVESLGAYDLEGIFREVKNKNKVPANFDEDKLWKSFFNAAWIDKKTRKLVRAELRYKNFGGISIDLLPISKKSVY